jgi:formylglycine-generating enzyme required for sulfatase activity
MNGLEQEMEGEIEYEILVARQRKRIIPAKVRLSKVEDSESIGVLYDVSGTVNVGYAAQFIPKSPSDLLIFFNGRASESYAAKDFKLAQKYYRRILEILPGDAFAEHRLKDCDAQIAKQEALMRERRNIPYYREVVRASLESGNSESLKLARDYVDKILSLEPDDAESLKYREKLAKMDSAPVYSAPIAEGQVPPPPSVQATAAPEPPVALANAQSAREPMPPPPPGQDTEQQKGSPPILRDMVRLPEGDYSIVSLPGRSPFENELPRHPVHLDSFYMDRYEVTNEEYKRFCDATGHAYPDYFSNKNYPAGAARKPVSMVSWEDADSYARWAGKRLPTEFEWEAAAAGTSGRIWPWGNRWVSNEANTRESGEGKSADVGSHPFDISEFGIYDMAGNVSEWTQDWYQSYPGNRRKEKEYGERYKVLRGGSSRASKDFASAQFRARLPTGFRSDDLGFRCARSAKEANP